MESSLLEQQIRARNEINQLTSFPAELITQILCWLPSFSDILSFAATCRRHRQIWTENVTVIYNHIAPRAIKCRRNARILLADQGGAAADSPVLSVRDVLRLIRNSHIVEKAIARFNRDVVRHVRVPFPGYYETEGGRPPCLTRTERPRFIRSYYQVWSLMRLDPASRQQRLKSMTLKQLYTVYDVAGLQQDIGDENAAAQYDRHYLPEEIWEQIQRVYPHLYNVEAYYLGNYSLEYGYPGHVVLFDHFQEDLNELVCGQLAGASKPDPATEPIWQDTSDEER